MYIAEASEYVDPMSSTMCRVVLPNNLFYCGDTCQTITRGVGFRFEDIRTLFFYERRSQQVCRQKTEASNVVLFSTCKLSFFSSCKRWNCCLTERIMRSCAHTGFKAYRARRCNIGPRAAAPEGMPCTMKTQSEALYSTDSIKQHEMITSETASLHTAVLLSIVFCCYANECNCWPDTG